MAAFLNSTTKLMRRARVAHCVAPALQAALIPHASQTKTITNTITLEFKSISSTRSMSSYISPAATVKEALATGKVTITTLRKMYRERKPIVVLTAHDYPTGRFIERAGVDVCLVGDSLAMVALGHESTSQITLDEMMHHTRAVARGSKRAFLVGDLPFGSYEVNAEQALQNAIRYVKEGGVEAVKLEGGIEVCDAVRRITSAGIPVVGHIGLTPQRQHALGGFKVQGKTLKRAQALLQDALALQEAGCFSIVLEAIPEPVSTFLTRQLSVPTIGIGAGGGTSGQVLVMMDMLGSYDQLLPKFCQIYASIGDQAVSGINAYADQVRSGAFPVSGKHTYKMNDEEEEKFREWAAIYESSKTNTI